MKFLSHAAPYCIEKRPDALALEPAKTNSQQASAQTGENVSRPASPLEIRKRANCGMASHPGDETNLARMLRMPLIPRVVVIRRQPPIGLNLCVRENPRR